jgi:hypothetical protein
MGIVRIAAAVLGSFLILLPLLFLLNSGAAAAEGKGRAAPETHTPAAAAADCATAGNVPVAECLALVELYSKTNGVEWMTRTNWLFFGPNAPCGWYGVNCADGHVSEVRLAGNALSGTLPLSLGNLRDLRRLRLENNALLGRIPPTICGLVRLSDFSIAYNALFTLRESVETCLAPLEADWAASQTTAVTDLRLTEITTDSLRFDWTPIAYSEDGGFYEIGIATTTVNGPYSMHGQTLNKSISSYVITDLVPGQSYFVRVRSYTPPHGDQPSDVRSLSAQGYGVTQAIAGRVLVAAYFPADNDLATEIPYVIERIRRGTAYNPNVQTVMLVDGNQNGDTRLLEISGGEVFTTTVVFDEFGVDELDSSDPEVLAWFLQHARDKFPSERNVAAIIGHGVALAPEIAWPSLPTGVANVASSTPTGDIPPLPKEHEYSPSDITNRGYMSAVDVGKALMAATDNGANPFDVIFFDQCFQGSLDVLYEVRNSARVYVASPNYAWLVAAYDRYMIRFTPTASPAQLAQAIVDNYEAALNPHHPNAIFWIRNSDLLAIASQMSILADALLAALQANEVEKIANAVQQSQYVDTTQCGRQNLQLGPPDELIGIESLGGALQASFAGDPYGISAALSGLQPLMVNVIKRSITGNPYIAPDEHWEFFNSLTVLAPLPRNSRSDVAWRASIYNDNMPFTATWTVDPSQPVTVTESLAFVRDGRWDEFLAEWYQGLTPTVGQWCHYIPPMQVVVSETEQLSLTVGAVTTDSLQLNWTPTDDTSAIEYWLYGQDPYAIGLQVEQVIPIGKSNIAFAALDAGDYRYMIVARNSEQETIAQSNEVTVTITGGVPVDEHIWLLLPFVTLE